ncbi:MAG: Helix-turn-helix domain [Pseudomonadota bacterium]
MALLGVSKSWLYKMRQQGRVSFTKLGGMTRIRRSQLERLPVDAELPANCLRSTGTA